MSYLKRPLMLSIKTEKPLKEIDKLLLSSGMSRGGTTKYLECAFKDVPANVPLMTYVRPRFEELSEEKDFVEIYASGGNTLSIIGWVAPEEYKIVIKKFRSMR